MYEHAPQSKRRRTSASPLSSCREVVVSVNWSGMVAEMEADSFASGLVLEREVLESPLELGLVS